MHTNRCAYKRNAANIITLLRIAGILLLACLRPLSAPFLWVYGLTGLTDVLDGWIARKTKTASDFGARLDSIADLLFYAVTLIRLFPALHQALPAAIWYAAGGILLLRLSAYCVAAVKHRRFASLHTWLNKLTGAAVFLLPYVLAVSTGVVYGWMVCVLALLASLEELAIHLFRPGDRADRGSIFRRE